MAKPKMTPQVHPKAAATGAGVKKQTPGNAGSPGPSNHTPIVGASDSGNYSSEQQQQ
jgi:hypothetical protein